MYKDMKIAINGVFLVKTSGSGVKEYIIIW